MLTVLETVLDAHRWMVFTPQENNPSENEVLRGASSSDPPVTRTSTKLLKITI